MPGTYVINFSPNGEWAILAGDIHDPGDINMYLVHLPDGDIVFNRNIITSEIIRNNYMEGGCAIPYFLFTNVVWSPDGRYIAFSANPDGHSLDLFTYDISEKVLRRLTNNQSDILSIKWSRDSNTIYYINGYQSDGIGNYKTYTINITNPDNITNQGINTLLVSTDIIIINSIIKDKYIIYQEYDQFSCTAGGLRSFTNVVSKLNIEDGNKTVIWSGEAMPLIAIDPIQETILIGDYYEDNQPLQYYLLTISGDILKKFDITEADFSNITYFGSSQYSFIGYGGNKGYICGITYGMKIENIIAKVDSSISISPDKKWLLVYNEKGFVLLDENNLVTNEVIDFQIEEILWTSNNDGVYIFGEDADKIVKLLFIQFENKKINMVFACSPTELYCDLYNSYNLTWINS